MDLSTFQSQVGELTATWTDPKSIENTESIVMLLTEEFGELSRAIRKSRGARSTHPDEAPGSPDDVVDELGDVLFLLARLALVSGVDLDRAGSLVIDKIRLRVERKGRDRGCSSQSLTFDAKRR